MDRKAQLAFGSAILTLLFVGATSYRALQVSIESERWVQHTQEVLENLQSLLLDVQTVESTARGFVLLGREPPLQVFQAALDSTTQHQVAVRALTADNLGQQQTLNYLDPIIARKLKHMQDIIVLRRTLGMNAAIDSISRRQGPSTMAEIRRVIHQMEGVERSLLAARTQEALRKQRQTRFIQIAGSLLGLLIASIAGWSVKIESDRRSLAEKALRRSESQFRELLEAAPDAMIVATPAGKIVLVNRQTETLFHYHRHELIGRNLDIIIVDGLPSPRNEDREVKTAQDSPPTELVGRTGRRFDGVEFPMEVMLNPIQSADGSLVTAAIRDITERRKAEEQIASTSRELARSNAELQQFAYLASHDLQEPLRSVASYTQLLARRYKGRLDPEADEFIAYAVDGCLRMKSLIQDLLSYSRAGGNSREVRQISAEDALQEAITNLRIAINESAALVTHELLAAAGIYDSRLVQVFQNLIGNAIKYRGSDPPRIHISMQSSAAQEWIFSVQDNGIGIDQQYFEKIFYLFQRLHGSQEFTGTGVGLAICKKVLERMGGRIWVESTPGSGSTFYFTLPAQPSRAVRPSPFSLPPDLTASQM